MEPWIDHLLMGCGGTAGLLLGTGNAAAGIALAIVAMVATCLLRAQAGEKGES